MNTKKGIDANTLKIIAVITMIIDHAGVALVWQLVSPEGRLDETWYLIYNIMRKIGRIAFPIYCFFIVEGLEHTRNVKKYLARLLIFAIASEVPFDYALFGNFTWYYQNVFFTLAIGLICIWAIKEIESRFSNVCLQGVLDFGIILAGAYIAEFLKTDYGDFGVIIIAMLYLFRKSRIRQCIMGAIGFAWEITAPLSFGLLYFYNGEKGKKVNKYLFYLVYPVHLLILWLLAEVCF